MDGVLGDNQITMRYYIKVTNHLKALRSLFFVALIMVGILFWLKFDIPAVVIFGIFFLLDAIPAIYLHLEYWSQNRMEEYEINEGEIIQYKNGTKVKYTANEIEKITLYKSASMDKGGIPFLAIESYFYIRILLKSGNELIITRLITDQLDMLVKQLKSVTFQRKKRLFCAISWK